MPGGGRQRQIAGGPGVGPTQRHQQIDVRRPPADAHHFRQRRPHRIVVQRVERVQVQAAGEDRAGQLATIARLLAAEPGGFERGVVQFQEPLRRQRRRDSQQPVERGLGRRQRHLLLQDDAQESWEARLPRPQRRRAEAGDDAGQARIARGQVGEGVREDDVGEWGGQSVFVCEVK